MFTAGSTVKAGFYFNYDTLDLIAVGNREGMLPGKDGERYARVPAVAALLAAPILGAAFIVIAPGVRLGLLCHRLGCLAWPTIKLVSRRLAVLLPSRRRPPGMDVGGEEGEVSRPVPPDTKSPGEPGGER